MNEERKPPVGFWITVAAVLLLYPLSWGPAYWACSRSGLERELEPAMVLAYFPIVLVYEYGPQPVKEALRWYLVVGAKKA